ncbi:MAG TPA: efflux RND transporter periplasmic adaptor subunit [Bacillota bacterium]|nr:efflux RND transporter periplasmic adaptor subunit [Bacillota bacterium]
MTVLARRRVRLAASGLVLAVLLGGGAVAGVVRQRRGNEATLVTVEGVGRSSVEAVVSAMGTLRPGKEARVRAPMSGTIEQILASSGQKVLAGDVLVRYQRDALEASLREAGLRVSEARSRLAGLELQLRLEDAIFAREREQSQARLRQVGIAYQDVQGLSPNDSRRVQAAENLTQAEAEYELLKLRQEGRRVLPEALAAARAALVAAERAEAAAQVQLARATVVSPIDGTVLTVAVEAGAPAASGVLLATVADLSRLRAEVRVDELDVGRVHVGQYAAVYPGAFLDEGFPGTAESVAPVAELEGRAARFLVTILLDNREGRLRPGMTVDAHLVVERADDVLSVPLQAVLGEGEQQAVLVVAGGAIERRPVLGGVRGSTRVEIRSGLAEGESVVVGPLHLLDRLAPGDRVRVAEGR